MAYLLDEKLQEIAQWLQAAQASGGLFKKALYMKIAQDVGLMGVIVPDKATFGTPLVTNAPIFGTPSAGAQQLQAVAGLQQAVKLGIATAAEAEAYLNTVYPGLDWSGGNWGDQGAAVAATAAVDASQALSDDPAAIQPEEVAQIAQSAGGTGAIQAAGTTPAVSSLLTGIGELPEVYDSVVLQDELDQFVQKVALGLLDVQQGNIAFKANTVPGGALVPGTVQPQKLDPLTMREYFSESPGPALAVKVASSRSGTIDRWVKGSTYEGPARVMRANTVTYPQGLKPTPGPARFRVVSPGMKFGVMSIMLAEGNSTTLPGISIRYGVILSNIPHLLGRVPQQIIGAWEGEAPVAMATIQGDAGAFSAVPPLFHTKASSTYDSTTPFPFMSAYNETGLPLLVPQRDADYGLCRGFDVTLITGRTAEDVYQQLNTRQGSMGVTLGETAHGPTATIPPLQHLEPTGNASTEETVSSPAPASVAWWNGTTGIGPKFTGFTEATDIAGNGRLVQGVPFAYDDCQRLIATDDLFSIVIQPRFQRYVAIQGGDQWSSPENWWRVGVQTVGPSGRTWAVDIIIE